jgi:hypothetical protein
MASSNTNLWYEESNYIATHIASVGYGLHIILFAFVTYYTLRERRKVKTWPYWLAINTVLFISGTVNLACGINFNQLAWINDRDYPGGPFNFLVEQATRPVVTVGNCASIIAALLADAVLLYRVAVLYNYSMLVLIFPILGYLLDNALCIMVVIQVAHPEIMASLPLGLPAWVTVTGVNVLYSGMIVVRLLYNRHHITSVFGPSYGKSYLNAAALIVEGAVPYLILSTILLGLFGGSNTTQNLFIPLLIQLECISPELISLRVMLGRITPANPETTIIKTQQFSTNVINGSLNNSNSTQATEPKGSPSLMEFRNTGIEVSKEHETV